MLYRLRPHPTGWLPTLLGEETRVQEAEDPGGAYSSRSKLCQALASLGAVFNTAQLINYEFSPSDLKGYIGTSPYTFLTPLCVSLISILSFIFASYHAYLHTNILAYSVFSCLYAYSCILTCFADLLNSDLLC